MASLPNSQTVTYEEWLRMPEVSDAIEEVVNGEIRIMPSPSWNHAEIVQNLYDSIRPQVDKRAVKVVCSKFNLIIRRQPLTAREPDLAVFNANTMVQKDGRIHSAPQLVVEVLSPANTRREREEKLADYAFLGVPEMWVFAPVERTVEVLYLEAGQLRRHALLTEGILTPKHFPSVHVPISEIWPD
jgi:Uma2 family endonuclease